MRPELGFDALSTRRLVVGTVDAVVGAVMFLLGLFVRPAARSASSSSPAVAGCCMFLGVASLSSHGRPAGDDA